MLIEMQMTSLCWFLSSSEKKNMLEIKHLPWPSPWPCYLHNDTKHSSNMKIWKNWGAHCLFFPCISYFPSPNIKRESESSQRSKLRLAPSYSFSQMTLPSTPFCSPPYVRPKPVALHMSSPRCDLTLSLPRHPLLSSLGLLRAKGLPSSAFWQRAFALQFEVSFVLWALQIKCLLTGEIGPGPKRRPSGLNSGLALLKAQVPSLAQYSLLLSTEPELASEHRASLQTNKQPQ